MAQQRPRDKGGQDQGLQLLKPPHQMHGDGQISFHQQPVFAKCLIDPEPKTQGAKGDIGMLEAYPQRMDGGMGATGASGYQRPPCLCMFMA